MDDDFPTLDIKKVMVDPAGSFAEPEDIVGDDTLSRSLKLQLLEQWERDARGLAVADDEGMTGGEDSMLGRVRRAIRALDGGASVEQAGAATKHG